MQSVKVSDSHPPDAWDQQAHSLLAPGVCDFVWSASLPLSSSPYLFMPSPENPPSPPHPSHRTPFFQRQTQAQSLKLIHGVNVIFLPDFLCVSFSPPTPANQNPEASHVWVTLSPVHTGRGGWSPPSAVSPPWFLLFLYLHDHSRLSPPVDTGSFCLFSPSVIRGAPDYLRYPLVSFLWL